MRQEKWVEKSGGESEAREKWGEKSEAIKVGQREKLGEKSKA